MDIQCYGIEEREERANPPVQTDICKCTHFQPITSTCFNRNVGVGGFWLLCQNKASTVVYSQLKRPLLLHELYFYYWGRRTLQRRSFYTQISTIVAKRFICRWCEWGSYRPRSPERSLSWSPDILCSRWHLLQDTDMGI